MNILRNYFFYRLFFSTLGFVILTHSSWATGSTSNPSNTDGANNQATAIYINMINSSTGNSDTGTKGVDSGPTSTKIEAPATLTGSLADKL